MKLPLNLFLFTHARQTCHNNVKLLKRVLKKKINVDFDQLSIRILKWKDMFSYVE